MCDSEEGNSNKNFDDHNGETAKKRAQTAKRVAGHKARFIEETQQEQTVNDEGNADSVSGALPRGRGRDRSNTPPTPKGEQAEPAGFVRFWAAWPKSARKGGKAKCLQLWWRSKLEPVAEQIVSHVERMAGEPDWTKEAGAYIPAPMVYLNQRRWDGADLGELHAGQDRWGGAL